MFSDNDDIRRLMSTGYDYEMMLPTIKDLDLDKDYDYEMMLPTIKDLDLDKE